MKALHHTPTIVDGREVHDTLIGTIGNSIAQLSEAIWLTITFLLFIVLGPFSVIAVLYGLWSLATGENRERMLEPVSLSGN